MKELSIEEKARRYDEALKAAEDVYTYYCDDREQLRKIESIFHELKESEDERIRKYILKACKETIEADDKGLELSMETTKKLAAYLEKQCEHKKFHDSIQVGDKVTRNEDGVLVNLSQLKRVAKKDEKQGEQKASYTTIVETGNGGINALVTRELPIDGEQKPAECRQEPKPNGGIVSEDFNEGDGYYKVNLAYLSKSQVELIENLVASWQNTTNNTKELSEEDEELMKWSINNLTELKDRFGEKYGKVGDCINWLKSLKPQNRWKPTKEQIMALRWVLNHIPYDSHKEEINGLVEQLIKLYNYKENR